MDNTSFNSKILLFGEYGIMHNSDALSIPYKKFNGFLSISDALTEDQKISNRNIESLYEYIIQDKYLNDIINSDNLKEEIDSGLYFDSNIPIGKFSIVNTVQYQKKDQIVEFDELSAINVPEWITRNTIMYSSKLFNK